MPEYWIYLIDVTESDIPTPAMVVNLRHHGDAIRFASAMVTHALGVEIWSGGDLVAEIPAKRPAQ